jgi:phosphoribosylamine-glycine ligase
MSSAQSGVEPLRILLVGNGGREHTLVWKLAQAPSVEAIFVAPGAHHSQSFLSCLR